MNLAVIGTGYVGLVAAVCLADSGNRIIGVDSDTQRVAELAAGRLYLYEPGLQELLDRNLRARRLEFTQDLGSAVAHAEVLFIAVGTPSSTDGSADVSQVMAVAESIAAMAMDRKVVVIKSTVPVGTADRIEGLIRTRTPHDIHVVSNPEFLKEGTALHDFLRPDRVVLGAVNERAVQSVKELYVPFVRSGNPILVMDRRSAEMTKYAANLMLAARISLVNEIANLCERVGADVEHVRRGIGTDNRIGPAFLFAGLGYGGSCFPKDLRALIAAGRSQESRLSLAEAVDLVNQGQRQRFLGKIDRHFGGDLKGRRVAIWGLAFKPGTDDIREAPSITIIQGLLERGALVTAHDPQANETARAVLGGAVKFTEEMYEGLQGAEALILITEWPCFRQPDLALIRRTMKSPVIFDGRNICDPAQVRGLGFKYYGIGRP
ncbi:MAG TPA: UDP-glucose/GDP-mannose dehydrogenase family protein [Bacillota bacterium]|nr:UDP-glucose/GDP-mannose dehydrogenase family protein [Bacillota bacterium]